ncbi:MAG TPA: DUF5715 family protein [Pyrinomonadaceae bacterium]|nr:DUF5715 family protein [Pyrinomonadaceae bacterium]
MDQEGIKDWVRKFGVIAAAILLFTAFAVAGLYQLKRKRNSVLPTGQQSAVETSIVDTVSPLQIATQKVEEDRGEPTGNKAEIKIPAELKLYQDRRRFLAIQVAEWREQRYEIPADFYDLASMTKRGEFTALPLLTPDYILYGVGLKADEELTHYDEKTGKSVPLFGSEAELEQEIERLNNSLQEIETRVREIRNDVSRLKSNERALRREKLEQIAREQKAAAAAERRRDFINSSYKSKELREQLTGEYQKLAELAGNLDGLTYDLKDGDARRKLKVHLLSALRPPARVQLEEIARAYREKFNRPLPLTSLVRSVEYQRHLGDAGNPNAIRIDVPPHTTGLAFDIYTYYMTAAEQQFLMDLVAQMEREGRVEALRENRFHIHVFAFADMKPPSERLIKESLTLKASGADGEQ